MIYDYKITIIVYHLKYVDIMLSITYLLSSDFTRNDEWFFHTSTQDDPGDDLVASTVIPLPSW